MGAVTLNSIPVYPVFPANQADRVKVRAKLEGEGNGTSSLKDLAFANYRIPTTDPQEKIRRAAELNNWRFCLEKSRASIENHLEQRVSLVFMQAVLCYKTNYRFREGHTLHQGYNAQSLSYQGGVHEFNAAHRATVPCIYARSPQTQQEIVYLYRSGYYDEGNATDDLLKKVNNADRAIDEKFNVSLLRENLVALLNRAAVGELTPDQVVKRFVEDLLAQIDVSFERETDLQVKDVLQVYRNRAELLRAYVNEAKHIDRWLDLRMDDPAFGYTSNTVEKIKHNEPVDRVHVLTLIKKKIEELPAIIMQERHQRENESRAPNHFYDLFHYTVLNSFQEADRRVVEEALGMQFQALSRRVAAFQKTGTTRLLLARNAAKVNSLVQGILPFLASLNGQAMDAAQLAGLSSQKQVSLRPGIYRLRYQIIRADQETQSKIKSKIESALNAIKNTARSKTNLETFFYASLIAQTRDESVKRMFYKLLNISGLQLSQRVRELKVNVQDHAVLNAQSSQISLLSGWIQRISRDLTPHNKTILSGYFNNLWSVLRSTKSSKTLYTQFCKRLYDHAQTHAERQLIAGLAGYTEKQLDTFIENTIASKQASGAELHVARNVALVKEVAREAFTQIAVLQRATQQFRHRLLVELRLSHGMNQGFFKSTYRGLFPHYPMSDGTLSNLENGQKAITPMLAKQISQIFGVDRSLFYPSHFAEVEA